MALNIGQILAGMPQQTPPIVGPMSRIPQVGPSGPVQSNPMPAPNPMAGNPVPVPAGLNPLQTIAYKIQNDPNVRKAMLTAGLSILGQPQGDFLADLGRAGTVGLGTLEALRNQQRQQAMTQRAENREERKVALEERKVSNAERDSRFNKEMQKEAFEFEKKWRTRDLDIKERDTANAGRLSAQERIGMVFAQKLVRENPGKYKSLQEAMPEALEMAAGLGNRQQFVQRYILQLKENQQYLPEEDKMSNDEIVREAENLASETFGDRIGGPVVRPTIGDLRQADAMATPPAPQRSNWDTPPVDATPGKIIDNGDGTVTMPDGRRMTVQEARSALGR